MSQLAVKRDHLRIGNESLKANLLPSRPGRRAGPAPWPPPCPDPDRRAPGHSGEEVATCSATPARRPSGRQLSRFPARQPPPRRELSDSPRVGHPRGKIVRG